VPHWVSFRVPVKQSPLLSQQPRVQPLAKLQTHTPPLHTEPTVQGAPRESPHVHWPVAPSQRSDRLSQVVQASPGNPQVGNTLLRLQFPDEQQPLLHAVALQVQPPCVHACPSEQAAPPLHAQAPVAHWFAPIPHAPHAAPAVPHDEVDCEAYAMQSLPLQQPLAQRSAHATHAPVPALQASLPVQVLQTSFLPQLVSSTLATQVLPLSQHVLHVVVSQSQVPVLLHL
jgi:hypothetical protein